MGEIRYLISDASKKVDVETHVLRYWEEELGISIPRNEMGHRYYTEFHIRLFCQVKKLKDKGYQLKAIKNALQQVMAHNQGLMETGSVLEEDMSQTLQGSGIGQGDLDCRNAENKLSGNQLPAESAGEILADENIKKMSDQSREMQGEKELAIAENCEKQEMKKNALSAEMPSGTINLADYNRLEPAPVQVIRTVLWSERGEKEDKENSEEQVQSASMPGQELFAQKADFQAISVQAEDEEAEGKIGEEQQAAQEEENREDWASSKENENISVLEKETILEINKEDGQSGMKSRVRSKKKPSAWERRNGMLASETIKSAEGMEVIGKISDLGPEKEGAGACKEEDRETANGQESEEEKAGIEPLVIHGEESEINPGTEVAGREVCLELESREEKMRQFQEIMNHIIGQALEENSEKLSREISGLVNQKLSEELEELMRIRDQREEERYRQLDEIIRTYQRDSQGKAEAAAARIPFFKRKRFGRNGKPL